MKKYWLSWWCPSEQYGKFELHWPWWVSGTRLADDAQSICCAVQAENEDAARQIVLDSFDAPRPAGLDWRFITEKHDEWSPYCGRFSPAPWMRWP